MDYTQAILLGLQGIKALAELVGQLKTQSGMSNDELLALAEQTDAATRDQIAAFLKTL